MIVATNALNSLDVGALTLHFHCAPQAKAFQVTTLNLRESFALTDFSALPGLPPKTIAQSKEVSIQHFTKSGGYGHAHLHVKGGGRKHGSDKMVSR